MNKKLIVSYDVLPSDWSNLVSTFIEGGIGRDWWSLVEVQHLRKLKRKVVGDTGNWVGANYAKDETYADDKTWRIVLHTDKTTRGDSCFDGIKWGWNGEGDKVMPRYGLGPNDILRAAVLDPALFVEWIESGERNISSKFDSGSAESIMQLAAFGVLVYS